MKALKLALSFLRIPRLFVSLLLFPLAISLVLVVVQVIITGVVLKISNRSAEDVAQALENRNQGSLKRRLIFGTNDPINSLKICRWSELEQLDSGLWADKQPGDDCGLDRYDLTINTTHPESFDVTPYLPLLEGNVNRLHICQSCRSGTVITETDEGLRTDTDSIWGLWILHLIRYNPTVQARYVEAATEFDRFYELFGTYFLHVHGYDHPLSLIGVVAALAVVTNIAMLIIVALFLALKAHRKVLDYFARNGALLPLVAANGAKTFYSAIWIMTIMRVSAFLLAAVPFMISGIKALLKSEPAALEMVSSNRVMFALWVVSALASLSLATLIASIAELKQRHAWLSLIYRYVPLLMALLGFSLWAMTFLVDGATASNVRSLISSIPVIGTGPLLVAPILGVPSSILLLHGFGALIVVTLLLRYNSRWFAAHLEEI